MKNTNSDIKSSAQARGLRLESIRNYLGLSREDFAKKLSVSYTTLYTWEKGSKDGLPEKRARDILLVLRNLGVDCTTQWLLHGIEPAPTFADPAWSLSAMEELVDPSALFSNHEESEHLTKEVKAFRANYPYQTMEMVVPDNSMQPVFHQDQYVAGVKYTGRQIDKIIGQNCIIQTEDGILLLRHLLKGTTPGHYHLACLNITAANLSQPFLYDVKLLAAAPVIWARSKIVKAS